MRRAFLFVLLFLFLLLIAGFLIARLVALDTKTVETEGQLSPEPPEQRMTRASNFPQQTPRQVKNNFDFSALEIDGTELLDRDSRQGRLPPSPDAPSFIPPSFILEDQSVEGRRSRSNEHQEDLQNKKQILRDKKETALLAIVLDDVGVNQRTARRAIALQTPITISLMSYARNAHELSDIAIKNGHELMLHLPMQPKGDQDPGPHALLTQAPLKKLEEDLDWGLSQFQGYQGVNNHMGSLFTEWPEGMQLVMRRLRSKGVFFLDSKTTPNSYAGIAAEEFGIPFIERDIFIDNDQSPSAIRGQLHKAEKIARSRGSAVAVGHPYDSTLEILEDWLPVAAQRGISIVSVHEIISVTKRNAPPVDQKAVHP